MEDVDVQKLSRKELLQLCSEHNIRTAGIKHDDLIRLLQNKLHPPAADPPRATARSRNQTSADSPFSSPSAKGNLPAKRTSLPSPGSTIQRPSLTRPLLLVDDRSRNNSPEPSPRAPRKDQLSPNPGGVLPRKSTTTRSNTLPAQRSDLLRKKVNTLTTIGKLQAQERARPAQLSDGSSVKGRNNVVSAAPIGKQAQETRLQQGDRGASMRSRGTAAGGALKNIKSTSMPVKRRPGERTLGVKSNEAASRKGNSATTASSEAAASSPRASEGEASVAAVEGSHSDLGSHSFGSVSEVATEAGHHAMWEDSDADDAQSVSSEPVLRFSSQSERFRSPRCASAGSKLGRVARPSWESAHDRRSSSVDSSNAPLGKDSDLHAALGEENLISSFSVEDDAAFNLVGDAHGLEINSFLDLHSGALEVDLHHIEKHSQARAPESISMADSPANDDIAKSRKSVREQDVVSETAPSSMQEDKSSDSGSPRVESDVPTRSRELEIEANDIPIVSSSDPTKAIAAEGDQVLTIKENVGGFDSTPNVAQDDNASEDGAHSQTSVGKNSQLVSESSATCSPSSVQPADGPMCCSGKDYTITSTAECIERVHFNMDSAPLPHPDMERPSVTAMCVNRPEPNLAPDSLAGALDLCSGKSTSPCDEQQQDLDIKLRGGPKHDYNKDRSKKSNLLQSYGSEKVPLLQDGRETENAHLVRRPSFPSSILLWCSQFFSAIFGTRSQH